LMSAQYVRVQVHMGCQFFARKRFFKKFLQFL
jgi:hypothetical protein